MSRRRLAAAGLLAALLLAACDNSSRTTDDEEPPASRVVRLSGVVQKGLFSELSVNAYSFSATGELGEPVLATITADGQGYLVDLEATELVLLEAEGSFTSEIDGSTIELDQPLLAVVDVREDTSTFESNINIATTLEASWILAQGATFDGTTDALLDAGSTLLNASLGFPDGTDAGTLSYSGIEATSTVADPDLQLLLLSAALVGALDDSGQLYAGGFDAVVDTFANASSVEDAVLALSSLEGFSSEWLYDQALVFGGYDLPLLSFDDLEILGCLAEAGCSWEAVDPAVNHITVTSAVAREGDGEAIVYLRFAQPTAAQLSLRLVTADDSATSALDYAGRDELIRVPAGATQFPVEIPLVIDTLAESDEAFTVAVSTSLADYAVRGPGTVVISDALPVVAERRTDQLSVVELCVLGTGKAGALALSACDLAAVGGGFVNEPDAALAASLDLAAACGASATCPPRDDDWLVQFFLVADEGGRPRDERALGTYIYPVGALQDAGKPANARSFLLSLAAPATSELAEQAFLAGWTLRLEARIAGAPALAASAPAGAVLFVPAEISAGPVSLPIAEVRRLDPAGGTVCEGGGGYAVEAGFVVAEVAGFPVIAYGEVCVELQEVGPGEFRAVLSRGTVDLKASGVGLPPGHGQVLGGGFPTPVLRLGTLEFDSGFPTWLYHESWPFMLRIADARLTPEGIVLAHAGLRRLVDVDYSPSDPRAATAGGPSSNDAWLATSGNAGGTLWLEPGGVRGTIAIAAGAARTAFPRGDLAWDAFAVELRDSEILPTATAGVRYGLNQSTLCPDVDCLAAAPDETRLDVDLPSATLDSQGFLLGQGRAAADLVPAWGARDDGSFAFTRPGDLPAGGPLHLALPGYRMPATGGPGRFLLSHLQPAGGSLVLHPVGSRAFVDGNFHPVGISVGPETYRDASGAPEIGSGRSLAGLPLVLDNLVESLPLPSSIGAKYVLRNAGVTGVFNVDPAALRDPLSIYGFPFEFNRFALRLTDNRVDEFNWVDGRLAVKGDLGGPDGFPFYFSNLQFNCGARLGRMALDWEACDEADNDGDGVPDENCNLRLHTWQAPAGLFSAGFGGELSCLAQEQALTLQHDLEFRALDLPLMFETGWNAGGTLLSQRNALASEYRFDRRPGRPETGFGLSPVGGAKLTFGDLAGATDRRYGALLFPSARVSVPFWNALAADVRVANNASGPDDTVVFTAGGLASINPGTTNAQLLQSSPTAATLTASYAWGNTGFGFDLPVRFRPWRFDLSGEDADAVSRQSRFIGETETRDLFVMETERGINFIEPQRTKLSFGASAKIAELGALSFQLDLDDPGTLRRVDDFLLDLDIIRSPVLEPGLSDLQDSIFAVNRLAGRGLEDLMREGLELSLEQLGAVAADLTLDRQDPFVTASEAIAVLNALPAQAIDLVEAPLRVPFDALVGGLEAELRAPLLRVREGLLATEAGSDVAESTRDSIAAARALLAGAVADLAGVESVIGGSVGESLALAGEMRAYAIRLQVAAGEVDRVLQRAVTFVDSSCSNGFIPGAELNGYIEEVIARFTSVRRLLGLVERSDLLVPLAELLARDPEVRQRVQVAQQGLARRAGELAVYLGDADLAVRSVVCTDEVDQVLAGSRMLLDEIKQAATDFARAAQVAQGTLRDLQDGLVIALAAARAPMAQALAVLDSLEEQVDGALEVPGDVVLAELEAWLRQVSNDEITVLVATAPGDADVVTVLTGRPRVAVDALFTNLRAQVGGLELIPASYATPDQLRRLLVAELMSSAPVRRLTGLMNQHFEEIGAQVTNLVLDLTDQLNFALRKIVATVESQVNGLLDAAVAPVRNMPLRALDVDGFAVIAGNELERVHVGAEWELAGGAGLEPTRFAAAFVAERWGAVNGPGTCGVPGAASRIDAKVLAAGLPLGIGGGGLVADKLELTFTLAPGSAGGPPLSPRGLMGSIFTTGELGFGSIAVLDPGLTAGIGDVQNYLGATAKARIADTEAEAAFLLGRLCAGSTVLAELDPEFTAFLPLPSSDFNGGYARAGATFPLIPGSCLLNVSARADFAAWVFGGNSASWGGLVSGGAFGEVACVGGLRGQVSALGEKRPNGSFRFLGSGFGVAGGGWCEPETWTSVARSRDDEWCATSDAQFQLEYGNGSWSFSGIEIDGVY